jgi:hypothetical protein
VEYILTEIQQMIDRNSLKNHVFNKEVAAVWLVAWLYPWYRPIFTQTSSQNVNLVSRYLLSPLEFVTYYVPMTLGGGVLFVVFHISFAVTVVFLIKLVVDKMTNQSHSES